MIIDRNILYKQIVIDKIPYETLGHLYNMSGNGIKKNAKRMNIPLPIKRKVNPKETFGKGQHRKENRICPICQTSFYPAHKRQVYCSCKCSHHSPNRHYLKKYNVPTWDGVERLNMWNILRIVDNNGYKYALVPNHPHATSTGYVYLHRIVVENFLGRILKQDEVVHHIDLNKSNNDITNLAVMTAQAHAKLHAKLKHIRRVSSTAQSD